MLATTENRILPMSAVAIEKVKHLTAASLKLPQVEIETMHIIHGGMYARTIMIPAGVTLTGALIKIATIIVISGNVRVFMEDSTVEIEGYRVLIASGNRKQAFYALTDTWMTMIFPSKVSCVKEAEMEFTDETDMLISRKIPESNHIIITGE